MEIKYRLSGKVLHIYLYGELDECSAGVSKGVLDDLISDNLKADKIVFNMDGVSFMDSTGVGMLIGRYKKIKKLNIPVYIAGANSSIEKVINLSGLYAVMPKY